MNKDLCSWKLLVKDDQLVFWMYSNIIIADGCLEKQYSVEAKIRLKYIESAFSHGKLYIVALLSDFAKKDFFDLTGIAGN